MTRGRADLCYTPRVEELVHSRRARIYLFPEGRSSRQLASRGTLPTAARDAQFTKTATKRRCPRAERARENMVLDDPTCHAGILRTIQMGVLFQICARRHDQCKLPRRFGSLWPRAAPRGASARTTSPPRSSWPRPQSDRRDRRALTGIRGPVPRRPHRGAKRLSLLQPPVGTELGIRAPSPASGKRWRRCLPPPKIATMSCAEPASDRVLLTTIKTGGRPGTADSGSCAAIAAAICRSASRVERVRAAKSRRGIHERFDRPLRHQPPGARDGRLSGHIASRWQQADGPALRRAAEICANSAPSISHGDASGLSFGTPPENARINPETRSFSGPSNAAPSSCPSRRTCRSAKRRPKAVGCLEDEGVLHRAVTLSLGIRDTRPINLAGPYNRQFSFIAPQPRPGRPKRRSRRVTGARFAKITRRRYISSRARRSRQELRFREREKRLRQARERRLFHGCHQPQRWDLQRLEAPACDLLRQGEVCAEKVVGSRRSDGTSRLGPARWTAAAEKHTTRATVPPATLERARSRGAHRRTAERELSSPALATILCCAKSATSAPGSGTRRRRTRAPWPRVNPPRRGS